MNDAALKLQKNFDEHFGEYRDVPIGIYGIGKNAQTILENIQGYRFECLIATDHLHETMYGRDVLSLNEAVERVSLIIIAAIPASTAIVYDRIKSDVPSNIPVFGMHGRSLAGNETYRDNEYWKCSAADLYRAIDEHDVISFDIFDTLIMRRVLEPRDVFDLVTERIAGKTVLGKSGFDMAANYKDARINAEKKMYGQYASPTIDQIYECMGNDQNLDSDQIRMLRNTELETELSVCVCRKITSDALFRAISSGKRVFLTSDMYFGEADIRKILSVAGIDVDCELIVSCDQDATKESGELFDILKDRAGSTSILHIGDGLDNDIEQAKRKDIDAFYVKKGYDILAESSGAFIFDKLQNSADRRMLGFLISEMFNDPFVLNDSEGKLNVRKYRDFALRILPITAAYMAYIIDHSCAYDMLLFASRDGYFLSRMYEKIRESMPEAKLPSAKYVYMSRSAVSGASIMSDEDIEILSNKIKDDPKLNLRDFYRMQFHIELPKEFDMTNAEAIDKWGYKGLKEKLSTYNDKIIANSSKERERYLGYLRSAGVTKATRPAIIDIVTQGTLVYGLGRILGKDIGLIAMGTSCVPNRYIKETSKVHALYGNITEKIGDNIHSMSDFSETHLLLEMLYGSTDGQLQEFDDKYRPVFAAGTEYDAKLLSGVQGELENLLDTVINMGLFKMISGEFAMNMLRTCIGKYSEYTDEIYNSFSFNDPYDGSLKETNLIEYIK